LDESPIPFPEALAPIPLFIEPFPALKLIRCRPNFQANEACYQLDFITRKATTMEIAKRIVTITSALTSPCGGREFTPGA
jgi:hypothetical protein